MSTFLMPVVNSPVAVFLIPALLVAIVLIWICWPE